MLSKFIALSKNVFNLNPPSYNHDLAQLSDTPGASYLFPSASI